MAKDKASEAQLWAACRHVAGRGFDDLAERVEARVDWDDIVLPDGVTHDLHALVAQVRHRREVYRHWGLARRLPRGCGVTALFAGPSGTGKTMAAEVVADAVNLDLYRIDLSSVVSKYIGETEKNLRRVFDTAEAGGAVLFLDEADALSGERSEVRDSHDRCANIEVSGSTIVYRTVAQQSCTNALPRAGRAVRQQRRRKCAPARAAGADKLAGQH